MGEFLFLLLMTFIGGFVLATVVFYISYRLGFLRIYGLAPLTKKEPKE